MPTIEGIIFVTLALYFFARHPDRLFPLLVISTVFQASSIISSGPVGIQPYYFVAFAFILNAFVRRPRMLIRNSRAATPFLALTAFLILGVTSALVLPILFAGVPVYDPHLSIDAGLLIRPPLHLQMENLSQAVLLIINVLVVAAAAANTSSVELVHKAFLAALWLIVGIVLVQCIFFAAGIHFPDFIFANNPAYAVAAQSDQQFRPQGPFSEPSMAGAALAAYSGAFLAMYLDRRRGIAAGALASLTCLLVASSSALAALAAVVLLLAASQPLIRWPCYIRLDRVRRLSIFLITGVCCASLLLIPMIRSIMIAQTVNKSSSVSAVARFAADLYALNLVAGTHGLGVGLGSNRPSSFITSVLSQIGVAGSLLLLIVVIRAYSSIPRELRWIRWGGLGLMLSMCAGIPDLSYPLFWVMLAMAVQSKASRLHQPRGVNDPSHSAIPTMSPVRTAPT